LKIPIIILTGVKDKNIVDTSFKMGAVDFICKPFDMERLDESIMMNIHNTI